jgi:hypothetical protein
MTKTLTAKFESSEAARNAHDDLIDSGYPSETLFLDRANAELKVMAPDQGVGEARELLGRHRPTQISARDSGDD